MNDDDLDASTTDGGDFEVTSNSVSAEELSARLTGAEPEAKTEPDAAAKPEAETPTPPVEATEAGKALPKGDAKAGKTLSDRARTIQAEINQLTAQKHTTRREAEAARAELEDLRQQKAAILAAKAELSEKGEQKPAAPAVTGAKPKPTVDQFDTYELYSDALAEWATEEAERRSKVAIEQAFLTERQRWEAYEAERQQQGLFAQHQTRIEEARGKHTDFDELITANADLPTNPMMDTHIMHSDLGGELMHYLAANPEECERIAGLAAGPTLVALGRIEARLEAAKSGPALKVPAISHAKPPIKPVGGGSGSADEPPGDNASLDEHVAYWNPRERAAGRR